MNRRKAIKRALGTIGLGAASAVKPIEAKDPPKLIKRFEKYDSLSFQRLNEIVDAINDLKQR